MTLSLKKVTILGSGTSTGVPVIACPCAVCHSDDPKNKRLRASILLEWDDGQMSVVDTGPDFRQQMLNNNVLNISDVFFTHLHADHCHGFDDLRAFAMRSSSKINIYGIDSDLTELQERFKYVFDNNSYRGALPSVSLHEIPLSGSFLKNNTPIETVRLPHGHATSSAYKIGSFAYATDFKGFPSETLSAWRGKIKVMIASGIHFGNHSAHNTIDETLELFNTLEVPHGIITHLSHRVDFTRVQAQLPKGVELGFDQMAVEL